MTIKEAREEAGLTQKQVQELVGIPIRSLQNWESGVRVCPQYVEDLIVEKIHNCCRTKRFIVLWEDHGIHQEYVQADSAMKAVEALGIRKKQVREVAVCIPENCY